MYVCIYICIHTHVHSHTHTHTHMQDVGPVRGSAAMVSQAENWKLLQTIGDKPGGTLVDGDVVSAVEFDEQVYSYTQTGDVFACEHRRTHTHTHTHTYTHTNRGSISRREIARDVFAYTDEPNFPHHLPVGNFIYYL